MSSVRFLLTKTPKKKTTLKMKVKKYKERSYIDTQMNIIKQKYTNIVTVDTILPIKYNVPNNITQKSSL